MALTVAVLAALDRPRSGPELAWQLGLETGAVERELTRLEHRGYVRRASCGGPCGACSLRSFCEPQVTRWERVGAPVAGPFSAP